MKKLLLILAVLFLLFSCKKVEKNKIKIQAEKPFTIIGKELWGGRDCATYKYIDINNNEYQFDDLTSKYSVGDVIK